MMKGRIKEEGYINIFFQTNDDKNINDLKIENKLDT